MNMPVSVLCKALKTTLVKLSCISQLLDTFPVALAVNIMASYDISNKGYHKCLPKIVLYYLFVYCERCFSALDYIVT